MIGLRILEHFGLYKPVDHEHKRFDRLAARLESPIEKIFWSAAYFELSKLGQLTPQVRVGPYRLDFALVGDNFKIAIECDGYDYHCTEKQISADNARDLELQRQGWLVVRFTGVKIYGDVQECVFKVISLARTVAL